MSDELDRLRLIHGLRLRSLLEAAELARLVGLDLDHIDGLLEIELQRGFVVHRSGRLSGWTLTASGRKEGERLLAEELDRSGHTQVIEAIYEEFLVLNPALLSICTDWQTLKVDGIEVVNDHRDPERDRAVLDRLDDLHQNSLLITQRLGDALDRFSKYGPRLSLAHERILTGETEWLTRSTIDSYHNVWFELHEDLLATLGRRRVDERSR
ncbi:MAG TPA: hypothetical protein VL068_14490 [Microthrixaceae bacterium]|nr:hypothetical protein [Microthrixaceae bacterium]